MYKLRFLGEGEKIMEKEILSKMNKQEKVFYDKFIERFNNIDFSIKYKRTLKIVIHSNGKEFEDIYIYVDGDEFTVGIGQYFHCHFDWRNDEESNEKSFLKAIDKLFEYLTSIFNNEIILWISMKDREVTGGCGIYNIKTTKRKNEYFSKLEAKGMEIHRCTWG